jgi:hypothetical protein
MRTRPAALALITLFSLLAAAACSDDTTGTVSIVTGDEPDTLTRAPAPTTLIVDKLDSDGNKSEITRTKLPTASIDLGNLPQTDLGSLSVDGVDDAGKVLVHGETLLVQWGALQTTTLEVFVQRLGELARMPLGPPAIGVANATVVVGRYIFTTDGATTVTLYDLLTFAALDNLPPIPQPFKSVATVGTTALLLGDTGATTLDLDIGVTAALAAPAGGNFGEVVGGTNVPTDDGSQFVVGATRISGGATPRILSVDGAGAALFVALGTPREGACAAWVTGRGLVVVGGAAGGPGAELLAPGATTATALPYPADPIHGCAATTLDANHVLVAGGVMPDGSTRPAHVLDLGCTTNCTPATWPGPVPLVRADATTLAGDAALVAGDDASGATHVYRVAAAGLKEVPLKTPRRGARLLAIPGNASVVLGGGAPGIEEYRE